MRKTLLLLTLLLIPLQAATQEAPLSPRVPWTDTIPGKEGTYYFYRGLDFGSQALISPTRLILNGGFGIMQVENRHNRPLDIMYGRGMRNVGKNLLNPGWSIGVNGFWDFLTREVIPISVNSGKAQYWPNYMNHLIGGGMSYRMMEEYYRFHEIPHSKWAAGATILAYHFLNEVVENDVLDGPTTDPVADFWLFNPAGVILFSNDRIARFFSETLHMADWSYQPVYIPNTQELHNNGQNYAVKYHLLVAKNLLEVDEISKTLDLAVSGGLFYDRDNSLLASLLYAKTKDYRYRLNLYPGLVKLGPLKPGFFMALNQDHRITYGVSFACVPLLPIGIGGKPIAEN